MNKEQKYNKLKTDLDSLRSSADSEDSSTKIVRRFLRPDENTIDLKNQKKLEVWMKANGINTSVTFFLNSEAYGFSPNNIKGHRDFINTACPGSKLLSQITTIRNDVRAKLS
jgi:hypothetical protein